VLDSVSIFYRGVPPNSGFGSFETTTHADTPVLWTLSEPYGSRDWWPCKNGLDDKADSVDILITAPSQYRAAANGLLQGETLVAGGTKKTTYWKHRYPIASYLVCFAVTNYTVFNNSVLLGNTNLPMQTFCYPESLAAFPRAIRSRPWGPGVGSVMFGVATTPTPARACAQRAATAGDDDATAMASCPLRAQRAARPDTSGPIGHVGPSGSSG